MQLKKKQKYFQVSSFSEQMYNESEEEEECFLENDPKICNASVPEVSSEILLEKY